MTLLNRFPSFQQLQTGLVATLKRFPFSLSSAFLGTVVAVTLVEHHDGDAANLLEKLLLAAALGLPGFTALTLLAEKRHWRWPIALAVHAAGVVMLAAYYFLLPDDVFSLEINPARFAMLFVGLYFLVACLPYLGGNQTNGFWHYNMSLFRRFLTAFVSSGVLFVGLTIALAAADHLFGFEVIPDRYLQLWLIMAGIFNTWIFLAGVPHDLEALDQATEYPKALGLFAQYILLPLVALYFVILISYEAKILITWNWPKGWVSELVLWFSVVGFLSLLLLYPLRKLDEKRWVQTFVKWFFYALIPLTGMLLLAILRRISDYGFTEPRYLVLVMAIGLVIVVAYFLISKARDIRMIPIIICAASFAAAVGPWSASAVSLSSQQGRLETMLTANGLLSPEGNLEQAPEELSFEVRKEMSSIIRYICKWHGPEPFANWLGEEAINSLDTMPRYPQMNKAIEMFGFEKVEAREVEKSTADFSFSSGRGSLSPGSVAVTGYDYFIAFRLGDFIELLHGYPLLDNDSCFVRLDSASLDLQVYFGLDRDDDTDAIRFQLSELLDSLVDKYGSARSPANDRTIVLSGDDYEAKLELTSVKGTRNDEGWQVREIHGELLLRRH